MWEDTDKRWQRMDISADGTRFIGSSGSGIGV